MKKRLNYIIQIISLLLLVVSLGKKSSLHSGFFEGIPKAELIILAIMFLISIVLQIITILKFVRIKNFKKIIIPFIFVILNLLIITNLFLNLTNKAKREKDEEIFRTETINDDVLLIDIKLQSDIIVETIDEYINHELNFPIDIIYENSAKYNDDEYRVGYYFSEADLDVGNFNGITFAYNSRKKITRISVSIGNTNGLSDLEKKKSAYIWFALLSCNSLNISKEDREKAFDLVSAENLVDVNKYELVLNGHKFACYNGITLRSFSITYLY